MVLIRISWLKQNVLTSRKKFLFFCQNFSLAQTSFNRYSIFFLKFQYRRRVQMKPGKSLQCIMKCIYISTVWHGEGGLLTLYDTAFRLGRRLDHRNFTEKMVLLLVGYTKQGMYIWIWFFLSLELNRAAIFAENAGNVKQQLHCTTECVQEHSKVQMGTWSRILKIVCMLASSSIVLLCINWTSFCYGIVCIIVAIHFRAFFLEGY